MELKEEMLGIFAKTMSISFFKDASLTSIGTVFKIEDRTNKQL